jgi:hypothetical protein
MFGAGRSAEIGFVIRCAISLPRSPWGFNSVLIRYVRKHALVQVNGITTFDDDIPEMSATGRVCWELTPESIAVTIKDIRLRALPDAGVDPGRPQNDGQSAKQTTNPPSAAATVQPANMP